MPPTNKETNEFIGRLQAFIREAKGLPSVSDTTAALKQYCKELHVKGWKKITVNYSGAGDSCDEFEATIYNEEGEMPLKNVDNMPAGFMEKVEDAIWNLLPSGFENNEGGTGNVKINIKTGKITVEHDQYYTEAVSSKKVY